MLQSLQRLLSRRPQSLRDLHLYSLRPPPLPAPPLYLLQSMRLYRSTRPPFPLRLWLLLLHLFLFLFLFPHLHLS